MGEKGTCCFNQDEFLICLVDDQCITSTVLVQEGFEVILNLLIQSELPDRN